MSRFVNRFQPFRLGSRTFSFFPAGAYPNPLHTKPIGPLAFLSRASFPVDGIHAGRLSFPRKHGRASIHFSCYCKRILSSQARKDNVPSGRLCPLGRSNCRLLPKKARRRKNETRRTGTGILVFQRTASVVYHLFSRHQLSFQAFYLPPFGMVRGYNKRYFLSSQAPPLFPGRK